MNGDEDGDGAGTRTGVEANEGQQDRNGDGSGDGNESSSGYGNEDKDRHGDGNEGGNRESEEEAKKRRRSARDHTRVVDRMWETGEIRVESGKYVDKKGLVQ